MVASLWKFRAKQTLWKRLIVTMRLLEIRNRPQKSNSCCSLIMKGPLMSKHKKQIIFRMIWTDLIWFSRKPPFLNWIMCHLQSLIKIPCRRRAPFMAKLAVSRIKLTIRTITWDIISMPRGSGWLSNWMDRWRATPQISVHSSKALIQTLLVHRISSMILETKMEKMRTKSHSECVRIPSHSRVTVGSCRGTTSLRLRLSSARAGSRPRLVHMEILVPSHMVSTSCRKKSTFLPDIKQNCASNFMKTSIVRTVSAASLFTPRI